MSKTFLLAVFTMVSQMHADAQVYVEPFAGYALDVRNGFNQPTTGLQLSIVTNEWHEIFFAYQRSWPGNSTGNDSAFTANASLPLYAAAAKTIRASTNSYAVGHRFLLSKPYEDNSISILLLTGITRQNIEVSYQYDRQHYTVLNPDQPANKTGFFVGLGASYIRRLKTGRVFANLFISTPPSFKKITYPSSFEWVVPLTLNIGYSIQLTKASK